jgi:phthalate 4,5-cis-dihydrodiol dehydrogenase
LSISDPVRLGVAGLGRGFMLTLPSLRVSPHVALVACAAPRAESRDTFAAEFNGRPYATVEALADDPDVEAVYIATPHQMHRAHAEALAAGGKHLLIDKPLAVTLQDADAIVAAAEVAGVHLITGPAHSFDHPVLAARAIIEAGDVGRPRMIHALNYTDFLYRPRRPEELDTSQGGGVLFSQAVHQIDVVRLLMGAPARTVSAFTGNWDTDRPTEGAYAALIAFEGGAFASLTYSGYAHFDSDIWQDEIGELGQPKSAPYGAARRRLATVSSVEEEARLKSSRTYGATPAPPPAPHAEHFGPVIVSCDRADLRITAKGVEVWGDTERHFHPTPPDPAPREPVFSAIYRAVRDGRPPAQAGGWGRDSLAICHAILESASTGATVAL